jgi:hypothetical protein
LLKSYKKRFNDVITSSSIMINEETHDEMKLILNSKLYRKRLQYLVKWLSWSNIENQWIYAEDVQIDELIKNFHQQYFNKFSTNASNAKRRRIEKKLIWLEKKRISIQSTRSRITTKLFNYFFFSQFNVKSKIFIFFRLIKRRREFAIFLKRN